MPTIGPESPPLPVTADNIGEDAVTQPKIADDVIDLSRMAHGTAGNLITYDDLGAPAAVATGAAGQALLSNGAGAAPSFQTLPAGQFQFVSQAAITSAALLAVTSLAADYDYMIVLDDFAPATNSNGLAARFSEDNGATHKSGGSDYAWAYDVSGGVRDAADSEIEMSTLVSNGVTATCSLQIMLLNPNSSGARKHMSWFGYLLSTSAVPFVNWGAGVYLGSTNPITALQFGWMTSFGTHLFKAQGSMTVWRRKRS